MKTVSLFFLTGHMNQTSQILFDCLPLNPNYRTKWQPELKIENPLDAFSLNFDRTLQICSLDGMMVPLQCAKKPVVKIEKNNIFSTTI